jgi:glutamine amidotransferase
MISIVDYGMGNLRSVQKTVQKLGYKAPLIDKPEEVQKTRLLIVPGVGAFDQAVKNLKKKQLFQPIKDHLEADKPYLGICLGLQLLFEKSEEGVEEGLSFYEGDVIKFKNARIIPHMGWNDVRWQNEGARLRNEQVEEPCYYFVHSYFPRPADSSIVAGVTDYGGDFCAAIREGNRFGVQFHPEKSQFAGLDLLNKILKIAV